jgi:carboxyl-terminal processing protease
MNLIYKNNYSIINNVRLSYWIWVVLILPITIYACGSSESINDNSVENLNNLTPSKDSPTSAPYKSKEIAVELSADSPIGVPEELKSVWEAWEILNKNHVDHNTFNSSSFEETAIKGLIDSIDDPHTTYVDPFVLEIEQTDLSGEFEGIGAHVRRRDDGMIQIISPIEGSPAESAGIKSGDIIISVDGLSIEGKPLLEAVSLIRGPRGSTVLLEVRHLGDIDTVSIEVTRDIIPIQSVLLRSEPGAPITHIRITEFKSDTPEQLKLMLSEEISKGTEGLILDLRSNPGGYLQQVFDIADLFLSESVILIEKRKDKEIIWESSQGGMALDLPLVILVDRYSASGSEILMGAFQDNQRAQSIGEKTFGKGTVNVFTKLSNGGGIYMSIGRWFTPNKRAIDGVGLKPDIVISSNDMQASAIQQLEKAYEVMNSLTTKKPSP